MANGFRGVVRLADMSHGMCLIGSRCCPHVRRGMFVSGSTNTSANGRPLIRLADTGVAMCPHGGKVMALMGSMSVSCNGRPIARLLDRSQCLRCGQPGTIMSGSQNVTSG